MHKVPQIHITRSPAGAFTDHFVSSGSNRTAQVMKNIRESSFKMFQASSVGFETISKSCGSKPSHLAVQIPRVLLESFITLYR
jgi:hypothetical protein